MKTESFLSRLYDILSLESALFSRIIRWNKDGNGIIISDVIKLSKIILPKYYNHHNYSSFVRQLNMYGFKKVKEPLNLMPEEQEYTHDKFNKCCTKDEIKRIPRKKHGSKDCNDEPNTSQAQNYLGGLFSNNEEKKLFYLLLEKIEGNNQRQRKLQEEVLKLKEQNHLLWANLT